MNDIPVFFDKNGKRWVKTKIVVLFILAISAVLISWALPQILHTKQVNAFQSASPAELEGVVIPGKPVATASELADKVSGSNAPVIGKGSLVRMLRIVPHQGAVYAVDPFTHRIVRPVTTDELTYLDGDEYAIERYGHTGSNKQIALTFDDGPHPIYTPKLLDLLSSESASASFFVQGSNVTKYPEIAQRLVREGHTIANHTFSHIDFDFSGSLQDEQEINQTERVISAVTNRTTGYFRIPYGGNTDQSIRNSMEALLTAQKMGYTVTSYDFDSNDWKFSDGHPQEFPSFNGEDRIVLVHDSGGDRDYTIAYVAQLIKKAKEAGYTFTNLNQMYPQNPPLDVARQATIADHAALTAAKTAMVWPQIAITSLFGISVTLIIITTILNIILSLLNRAKIKRSYAPIFKYYLPYVTVIVPSYNEGKVIINSVHSLLQSTYKNIEIIIVDDGSTDDTWQIAQSLASEHRKVRAIHQINGGKSSALNNAIAQSKGEIVVCVDADTIFPPHTLENLVRHFKDPKVGAVAGVVKVGNMQSMVTRWQALEYMLSITIERNAHAFMGSIMIVPGACGAWRKEAIIEAGGLSHSTLAEDCDLTMSIQKLSKYKILQDNAAISYTEVPQNIKPLIKQRFRWTFGNIQALCKHRDMIFDGQYGMLGSWVMPNAIVSILIPLFFWPVLMVVSFLNIISGNYMIVLIYFIVSLALQFIIAVIGVLLTRERLSYVLAVPFARFIYGPIRTYILYKTVVTAVQGSYVGWNKLVRTGTASYPTGKTTSNQQS